MKYLFASAALAFSVAAFPAPAPNAAAVEFLIPRQDVRTALTQFAQQAELSILFSSSRMGQSFANALEGKFSVEEGLANLLVGTGVTATVDASGLIMVTVPEKPDKKETVAPGEERSEQYLFVAPMAPASPGLLERSERGAQEVLVTARRREENIQDIPFAVSVLDTLQLHAQNVDNLLALGGQLPNVSINTAIFSGLSGSLLRMRGIPDATVYRDGVAVAGGALANMVDVERVEVLRGPQGTLFGRTALAGAIHIITREPSDRFWADAEVTFGNYDRIDVQGALNLPLSDALYLKLGAARLDRSGYVRSTAIDIAYGSKEDSQYDIDLLWRPSPARELRLQYSQKRNRSNGNPLVNFRFDDVCPGGPVPASWRNREGEVQWTAPNATCLLMTVDTDSIAPGVQALAQEFQSYGARSEYLTTVDRYDERWEQSLGSVKLGIKSRVSPTWELSGLFSNSWGWQATVSDLDGTGFDIFTFAHNDVGDHQFRVDQKTAEIQLQHDGEKLSGVAGIYWQRNPGYVRRRISWQHSFLSDPVFQQEAIALYGPSILTNPATIPSGADTWRRAVRNSSEQWAIFGEWTYRITNSLSFTTGLRYTEQRGRAELWRPEVGPIWVSQETPVNCCDLSGDIDSYYEPIRPPDSVTRLPTFREYTPRVSLQFEGLRNWTAYVSYARGAQPGGTNVSIPPGSSLNPTFERSIVKSYEAGIKTRFPGGQAALNVAAFYNDFRNVQVSEEFGYQPGFLVTSNADAVTQGIELEGAWAVTERVALNYAFGNVDARYTNVDRLYNVDRGTRFQYTPEFNFDIGAQYRREAARGVLTLRADWTWQDERVNQVDRLSQVVLDAYSVLAARISYAPRGEAWDLALFGTNLTNTYYTTNAFLLPPDQTVSGNVGRPREWGVSLRFQVK